MHAHYHWNYDWSASLYIANGVVGLREMKGDISIVEMIRQLSDKGFVNSPEIFSSNGTLNGPFVYSPPQYLIEDSAAAFEAVIEQKNLGADFIKIYSHLNRESFFAIAKQAKLLNIDFAGHLPESVNAFEAISVGQKSFEHNLGVIEATANGSDTNYMYFRSLKNIIPNWRISMYDYLVANHNDQLLDSLIHELATNDTWLCPTMVALEGISYQFEDSIRNDYHNKYLPQDLLEVLQELSNNSDTAWILSLRKKYEFDKSMFKKMVDGGVKFLAGCDFLNNHVYPGFSIHDELKIFNDAGFSSLQALQTATLNPALCLGKLNDYGTIEIGKIASMLILNSNPIEDIENTKDIEVVFLKGKYFSRIEIDSLLNIPIY
jgi:imidazolonepropionase-like amidohydrolase